MLRLSGAIAIRTHIDANKLESSGEDVALAEFKGDVVRLTDLELASHIAKGLGDCIRPVDYVVHNGARVVFLSMEMPRDVASAFHTLSMSCMKLMEMAGPFVGST